MRNETSLHPKVYFNVSVTNSLKFTWAFLRRSIFGIKFFHTWQYWSRKWKSWQLYSKSQLREVHVLTMKSIFMVWYLDWVDNTATYWSTNALDFRRFVRFPSGHGLQIGPNWFILWIERLELRCNNFEDLSEVGKRLLTQTGVNILHRIRWGSVKLCQFN